MTPDDIAAIVKLYSERLERHGISAQTLGWGEKDRRRVRFEILTSQWKLDGSTVLDFGCGFGDLAGFLTETCRDVRYIGVDINERLVEEARKLQPSATFHTLNLIEEPPAGSIDYVLASGVFNDRIGDNAAFIADAFASFDRTARRGFAANFLSAKAETRHPHAYYMDPAAALELCYRYSRRVVLRNDYMPFEFTVFVDKSDTFDPETAVYDLRAPRR